MFRNTLILRVVTLPEQKLMHDNTGEVLFTVLAVFSKDILLSKKSCSYNTAA